MRYSFRNRRTRRKAQRPNKARKMQPVIKDSAAPSAPLDLPPSNSDSPPQAYRDQRRLNAISLANAEPNAGHHIRRGLLESLTLEQAKRAHHTERISPTEWNWYAVLWRNAAPRYAPEMDGYLR